jgi:hypothetical protein
MLLLALVLAFFKDGLAVDVGCSGRTCLKGQSSGGFRVGGIRTRALQKKTKKAKETQFKSRMGHSKKLGSSPAAISDFDSKSNYNYKYKGSDTNSEDNGYSVVSNTASRRSATRSNETPRAPVTVNIPRPTPVPTPSIPSLPPAIPPTTPPPTPAPQVPTPPPISVTAPTPALPTSPPTEGPSQSPSSIPTEIPTRGPTTDPTVAPSSSPSLQSSPRPTPRSDTPPNEVPPTAPPPEALCTLAVSFVSESNW